MRNLFSRKTTIFTAIIILFIFGQLMGMATIKTFFIQYKIKELKPQIQYIADKLGEGDFKVSRRTDFIVKAYNIYGIEMNIFDDEINNDLMLSDDGIADSLAKYIPRIISGNNVADIHTVGHLPSQSIVIGVPISRNDHIIGVAFLLKPASDFQAVINGFSLVFFVTLLIGTIFIGIFLYLYIKETKNLEQTRRDYIANISHELKSPISSIKALTETLSDGMIQDEGSKDRCYGIILNESSRLEKLISDMLELSRLQSRKTIFLKEVIDAKNLMQNVFDKYSILANDMGIIFEMSENTKTLPNLYSNGDRILQIFNILINNAMKFVGENGKVIIDSVCHTKNVIIIVRDNGTGIEKNNLPYIFDRFYKQDKAHYTNGSGLGLSIAKEIVEGLDEKIYVNSEYGKGSEFSFTIKRA